MDKNNLLSAITLGLVIVIIGYGMFTVFVLLPEEQAQMLEESKQVAENWKNLDASETSCQEIIGKLFAIEEDSPFPGDDLIRDALNEKFDELDCEDFIWDVERHGGN